GTTVLWSAEAGDRSLFFGSMMRSGPRKVADRLGGNLKKAMEEAGGPARGMADLFISYARSDRPRAEQLAHALERAGWSVWWDREIPPGRSFDEVIEEALSLARCVIVLWSEASVRSEWVKTEASEAAQRRMLVPIIADG